MEQALVSSVKAKGGHCRVQLNNCNVLVHCTRNSWKGNVCTKGVFSRLADSESDVFDNAINEGLQSFDLAFSLGDILFDRDRFRQSGKSCSAIT